MTPHPPRKLLRCAIYTRKSTEHNLDLEFNSLDAQREACEAYIKSQAHEGWRLVRTGYDDGGPVRRLTGPSCLARPAGRCPRGQGERQSGVESRQADQRRRLDRLAGVVVTDADRNGDRTPSPSPIDERHAC